MEENFKEDYRFFHVYANIPLKMRSEIICVIDDEPLTWHTARLEIEAQTEAGAKALKQLVELKII